MERLMVVEVNELPKRVVQWWAERSPSSALASLLEQGSMVETVLDEELPRDLYPSQSWASLGMGVPYREHGVFWYGDPKPRHLPFYWQAAAEAGRSVGLVGVLHSSPLSTQTVGDGYRFVISDVFGDDPTTIPPSLAPIQELNLRLSRQSARVASLRLSTGDARGAWSFARHGVRPGTWAQLGAMVTHVKRGTWNRERLRVGQSLLLADVFEKAVNRHDPDLAVIFLNHVASFMHRYWAATFPEDWPEGSGYSEAWVEANAGELPFAMEALDRIIGRLRLVAGRSGRDLLVVSSMGQQADNTVDPGIELQAVLRSPQRFLAAAGVTDPVEIRPAMVPQVTFVAASDDAARRLETTLSDFVGAERLSVMTAHEATARVLTVTYRPECRADAVRLGGRWRDPADVGMTVEKIQDHRSGRHGPRGVLVSSRPESWPSEIDAFEFAPMVLRRLGVPALDHHRPALIA